MQLTTKHSVATPANWRPGEDVIVNFPLTDAAAEEKFGKDGFTVVPLPSEADDKGKWMPDKHYLRTVKDPTGGNTDFTGSTDPVPPAAATAPTSKLGLNDTFANLQGETQDNPKFDLYEYLGNSWGVVFMHPGDFTPVCTTELGAAQARAKSFESKNVKLCGFSCNDGESHKEWIKDIAAYSGYEVTFPLFCDPTREYSARIGVLDETQKDAKGLPLTVRSVFIISPDRVVKAMITYPASTGRDFDEILRCITSLQLTSTHKVATPVNWRPGEDVIVNLPLTDVEAETHFGKDSFKIVDLPSEADGKGKWMPDKHYLRTLPDPEGKQGGDSKAEEIIEILKGLDKDNDGTMVTRDLWFILKRLDSAFGDWNYDLLERLPCVEGEKIRYKDFVAWLYASPPQAAA